MCAGGAARAQPYYSDLHDFSTAVNASQVPLDGNSQDSAPIFDSQGNMYGTSSEGGKYGVFPIAGGVLWEISKTGTYTQLYDFGATVAGTNYNLGYNVRAGITMDTSGNIYGIAYSGGKYVSGVVWEFTKAGVYKDIHDFAGPGITYSTGGTGTDAYYPVGGPTLDSSGNLYGTATSGGAYNNGNYGSGIVWEITSAGKYIDLHDFGAASIPNANGTMGPDGTAPYGSVTLDASGNIYGTTNAGGPNSGSGIVWEISTGSPRVYKDLHDFGGALTGTAGTYTDGQHPLASVTFDAAANLYCTTQYGGLNNCGTISEITSAHKYIDFHDFGGTIPGTTENDGQGPRGNVVFDGNGNMFGAAYSGGYEGCGMVYEFPKGGSELLLHNFGQPLTTVNGPPYDSYQPSSVTLDPAGNVYGATYDGGPVSNTGGGDAWAVGVGVLTSVTVSTPTVVGPATATGTVTLSVAAPLLGTKIALTAIHGTVPATVTVPYGSKSVTFTVSEPAISGASPTTDTITATLVKNSVTCHVTVLGLDSIALSATSVTGGTTVTGTVSLNGPAPVAGTSAGLSVSSGSAPSPASVTFAAGSSVSTPFSITTAPVTAFTSVIVTATLGSSSVTQTFTILPPTIQSVGVEHATVVGGPSGGTVGTVTLTGPVLANTVVHLTWKAIDGSSSSMSIPSGTAVPGSYAMVPAGQSTGTFNVAAYGVNVYTVEQITAQLGSASASVSFQIIGLKAITLFNTTEIGGTSDLIILAATGPLPKTGDWLCPLSASSSASPIPVSLPAGAPIGVGTNQTTAFNTLPVTTNTTVKITATWGGSTVSTTLTVLAPVVSSVTLSPTSVQGSSSTAVKGTVTLSGPVLANTVISLKSSNPAVANVTAATTTATAKGTTATFTVSHVKVTKSTTVTITATLNGVSNTANLTVTP
jgi:hypothetical protein